MSVFKEDKLRQQREASKRYYQNNLEKNRLYAREYYKKNKALANTSTLNSRKKNPAAFIAASLRFVKKSREENPALWLFYAAKKRAKVRGHEFNIDKSDVVVPDICPALGIPIFKGYAKKVSDNSPNIDRIDNSKGYVKGNIIVISAKANRIKNNATEKEIRQVADWLGLIVNGL